MNGEISKLMNNPRFLFIAFKDSADSIEHNNSKFVSFGAGNNFIKSLQLLVDNVKISY